MADSWGDRIILSVAGSLKKNSERGRSRSGFGARGSRCVKTHGAVEMRSHPWFFLKAFHRRRNGRGDRIRTYDFLVPNQAHYQAVLHPANRGHVVSPESAELQVASESAFSAHAMKRSGASPTK